MSIQTRLALLISERRDQNGKTITPNKVAKATGVPQATLSRILNGEVTDVRAKSLEKLAAFFGVSVAYLRGEEKSNHRRSGEAPALAFASKSDDENARNLIYVTEQEMICLSAYRASNKVGRMAIMAAVQALSEQQPIDSGNVVNIKKP